MLPSFRISNTAPNISAKNTSPNIISKNFIPVAKIINGGSVGINTASTTFGGLGYLIGMLGLTYTIPHGNAGTYNVSDFKPNVRIQNV